MKQRTAIITGVTGQDGSYLSELLLEKGYKVYGMKRRASVDTTERIDHLLDNPNFELFENEIQDATGVFRYIHRIKPDELYNLAAMSHVHTSFDQPVATFNTNALGVINCLEAIRQCSPDTRFYQASTSEMFGNADEVPQNENTTLSSRSPYGVAKIAAHHAVRLYREAYGLFACAGILFNHESPRRGDNFVTRKITLYVAKLAKAIKEGKVTYDKKNRTWDISDFEPLSLGNLDARRDWGFAGCYVDAMYRMLQLDKPDDFVIATGKTNSIKRFLRHAFGTIGIDYEPFVVQNPKYMRPADINQLVGDASKAKKILGWRSNKDFEQLVREMVKSDLKSLGCSRHTATMTIWGKQCQGS